MGDTTKKSFLIFGSNGAIGGQCKSILSKSNHVFTSGHDEVELIKDLKSINKLDGVIWAQGLNVNDSIQTFEFLSFSQVLEANVTFVLKSLKLLLQENKIGNGSQLVILSSIWSNIARPNKLSYSISKSAINGLVRSVATDLGSLGISINSISPGPIDTPMTRTALSENDIKKIISENPLGQLITLNQVAEIVCLFAEGKLSGVQGQDLIIDGGWGFSKLVSN